MNERPNFVRWNSFRYAIFFLVALVYAGQAYASARVVPGPLPPGVITAIHLHDQGSGVGRGVSFGLPLPEGLVAADENLEVTTAQGVVLESQWNSLASWRTDGSVLHGVMTVLTPNAGSSEGIYYIRKAAPDVRPAAISKQDILGSSFDAVVEVIIGGVTYDLNARDLLSGSTSPRLDYTHYTGDLSSEYVLGGPLHVANSSGAAHPTLQAYFYIRAFKRPVESVFVTVVLENTGAKNSLSDLLVDSVTVRVGGDILSGFPKSAFTIYADIRYPKRVWWRGGGELWVQHDLKYVSDTKLMPAYRIVALNGSVLGGYPQQSEWNERRILSEANLEGGGAKPELAPHDGWTAAYMVSGDRRAWNAMRVAVDEYSMMVGSFDSAVVHARDEETGMPIDLTQKGVISQVWGSPGDSNVLGANRAGRPVAQSDIAHWPSIAYLTYLLTAESNEMENVQHSAVQPWLNEAPGGQKGVIPGRPLRWLQTRGEAWALREIVNGAVVTPDHHPLRFALQTSATYALEEYSKAGQSADPTGAVGLWAVTSYSFPYDSGVSLALWMNDFLTWAVGDAYERGWRRELDANGFWRWKAQAIVKRFGISAQGEYCWEYAAGYQIRARDTVDGSLYGSWAEIFDVNFPEVTSCAAPGTSTAGTDRNAVDYGAQIAGALAVAASTNVPGAAAAWQIYELRQKQWEFGFDRRPEWAIVPRIAAVPPKPPADLATQ